MPPVPAETRLPDDRPAWRDLRPLGYECVKWQRAMKVLQMRHRKGRLGESLSTFLSAWMPEAEVIDAFPESFDLTLAPTGFSSDILRPIGQPVWQALLHLPALRDFWTAELRASAYLHLLKVVPRAWCMDPTPLPPGSVISGLDIVSWAELPLCEAQGRSFLRHELELPQNPVVLTETSAISEGWRARYTQRDGEITLQEAFLPPPPSAGPNV